MKHLYLLTVFLLAGYHSFAQPSLPPLYEIKADSPVSRLDEKYWQTLVDSSGKLGIREVVSPSVQGHFQTGSPKKNGIGYSGLKHYWLRFRVRNLTGKEQRLVFFNDPRVSRFGIFVFRDNKLREELKSGWGVPYNQKDSIKSRNAVLVNIGVDEEILVYKKLELHSYEYLHKLHLGFGFYDHFARQEFHTEPKSAGDTRFAFIAGLLFFGFFLNLFFFWIVRERVYLYYALLLLLESTWYVTIGTAFLFRENPGATRYFDLVVTYFSFFFCVTQFVRHFLKTYKFYPRWDKLLVGLIVSLLAIKFFEVLFEKNLSYSWRGVPGFASDLVFATLMSCLLISFFLPGREKDRFSTLSVIAAFPAFSLWSIVYTLEDTWNFLLRRSNITRPAPLEWLRVHTPEIEMFCVGWFAILFTWILLQRYALLRKELTQQALERERERGQLMEIQKEELEKQVESRTAELKKSINELKSTQQQLIQSEKMASLGELTAGIAHEIQNPLNFVNNFSDVNAELVEEMKSDLQAGKHDDALQIAENIKQNSEKINFHGKRADSIVKSMLQHSRNSSGQKEPTDINALVDECLRLSFHGMRAKDKTFNAKTETDFDEGIGKIMAAPQEIGRVLLNLFTNAFYSVIKKKKKLAESYEPVVSVKTTRSAEGISIIIRDNGEGVPKQVVDKIFQPFFTTKPVGEGTGLGLSMSYDIITKGHGGELRLDTREGEYAAFTIFLPDKT